MERKNALARNQANLVERRSLELKCLLSNYSSLEVTHFKHKTKTLKGFSWLKNGFVKAWFLNKLSCFCH